MNLDWSAINTALIIGAIAYLYRQARVVDQVRAALLGVEGKGGALDEVKTLRERTHDLSDKIAALNGNVEALTTVLTGLLAQSTKPLTRSR